MLQAGERVRGPSVGARLYALFELRLALLAAEIRVGSPDLVRVGLIAVALGLQTAVVFSPGHFRPAPTAFYAWVVCLCTLGSLAATFLATLPAKPLVGLHFRQAFAAFALLGMFALAGVGAWRAEIGASASISGVPYNNDGAAMDLLSAGQVLHAHNPYLKSNILPALATINAPCTTTTPLMDGQFRGARAYPSDAAIEQVCLNRFRLRARPGLATPPEFESKYNYPAGSFLFILPFVWAGLQDMRFLYALAVFAMGGYLWFHMPRALRLLVPFLILAGAPIVMATTGGQPDPIYGLFLMIGYAEWRKKWVSPLLMGLAIATKQLAWFFLPFYLLVVVRHFGWRQAARRSGVMALVFLVSNGPFILQSPNAYLASVSAPMQDPMFPLGVGAIALFVANVLPMLSKLTFTVAELSSWVGGVATFARLRSLPPASGIVFAALPLFFAWRSLVNYFYLVPLLALAVALVDARQQSTRPARR